MGHFACPIPSARPGAAAWHRARRWGVPPGPRELFGMSVLLTPHLQKLEQPLAARTSPRSGPCCSGKAAEQGPLYLQIFGVEMTSSAVLLRASYKEAHSEHGPAWRSLHELN